MIQCQPANYLLTVYFNRLVDYLFSPTLLLQVDISVVGVTSFSGPEGPFDVDVFDSSVDYIKLMK
jgi:phosphoglucomutase